MTIALADVELAPPAPSPGYDGLPRYAAVAAHLHERAGDLTRAGDLYAEAARTAASAAERDHCVRQAARVRVRLTSPGC